MIIAIDYDNTFASDVDGWTEVIKLMQNRGHQFICLTSRRDQDGWGDSVKKDINGIIPIVFAGPQWKRKAAEKAGWKVNVFIDDMPETISDQTELQRKFR